MSGITIFIQFLSMTKQHVITCQQVQLRQGRQEGQLDTLELHENHHGECGPRYSGDLNNGIIRYSDGRKPSG